MGWLAWVGGHLAGGHLATAMMDHSSLPWLRPWGPTPLLHLSSKTGGPGLLPVCDFQTSCQAQPCSCRCGQACNASGKSSNSALAKDLAALVTVHLCPTILSEHVHIARCNSNASRLILGKTSLTLPASQGLILPIRINFLHSDIIRPLLAARPPQGERSLCTLSTKQKQNLHAASSCLAADRASQPFCCCPAWKRKTHGGMSASCLHHRMSNMNMDGLSLDGGPRALPKSSS